MNENNIKLTLALAGSTLAVALAARSYVKTVQEETAKREEIEKNTQLDLQAIAAAAKVMNDRIDRGEISSLVALEQGLSNEIAFQKIAIREN